MHTTGHPHSPPRPVAGCLPIGPVQKQVKLDLTDDLGNAPQIPIDLASSLGEDVTDEQIDAPYPPAPLTMAPHSCPMTLATSIIPPIWEKPNQKPVLPSLQLPLELKIQVQMIRDPQHPSWWKELTALYRDSVGDLSDAQASQLAQQWAVAFWLPTAQKEVSGWLEAPCSLCLLFHSDFLLCVDFPSTRDFWLPDKKKTLALVQALQHCAERLGMPPRVLCNEAWNLQRCMAPLMHLEGDEMVEALLLGSTNNGPRMSPTPEEEAVLLGDELEPQEAQEGTIFPLEHPGETPNPKNQSNGLMLCVHLPPQP